MEKKRQKSVTAVVSTSLPTGKLVELVFRPDRHETRFVVGHGDNVDEVQKLEAPGGGWYVPYSPRNNLLVHRVVLLPSQAEEYDSVAMLQALVQGFIHRYVDISPDFELIAAWYVLFTWLFDDFSELPYLRVQGDYGTGKSRFLQAVGSLAYKPIFASGASTVSPLFRILDSVGGTLIVDEADFRFSDEKAEIVKILNNGNARGFPVLRTESTPQGEFNPRAFDVFGPKLVATRGPFEDRALESRCLTEVMSERRVRRDVPLNLPRSFHQEAQRIRNKLLRFRLRYGGEDYDLERFCDRSLEPRVAQLFAPLLAVADDARPREILRRLARRYSSATRSDRRRDIPRKVLVLLAERLKKRREPIGVSEITNAFNARYSLSVSPRWMGGVLRQELGLSPKKSNGTYQVPVSDFPRLATLVAQYEVDDLYVTPVPKNESRPKPD